MSAHLTWMPASHYSCLVAFGQCVTRIASLAHCDCDFRTSFSLMWSFLMLGRYTRFKKNLHKPLKFSSLETAFYFRQLSFFFSIWTYHSFCMLAFPFGVRCFLFICLILRQLELDCVLFLFDNICRYIVRWFFWLKVRGNGQGCVAVRYLTPYFGYIILPPRWLVGITLCPRKFQKELYKGKDSNR